MPAPTHSVELGGLQIPPQMVTMQRAWGRADTLEGLSAALPFLPVTLGSL